MFGVEHLHQGIAVIAERVIPEMSDITNAIATATMIMAMVMSLISGIIFQSSNCHQRVKTDPRAQTSAADRPTILGQLTAGGPAGN